jgi:hypothetical protein
MLANLPLPLISARQLLLWSSQHLTLVNSAGVILILGIVVCELRERKSVHAKD